MKDPSQRCTIFIAGEVNSGKSSFLNALSGGIVSNVSLQRETFNPIWYQYSEDGSEENLKQLSMGLESVHKQNESLRQSIRTLKEEEVSSFLKVCDDLNELPVRYGLNPFNLVDCPGINDSDDTEHQLFFSVLQNRISTADLIIFITDATTAFSKASEIIEFKKIQQLVEEENTKGRYIELIIVVNKFDSPDDDDLCEIFNRIFEKLPIFEREKVFRFSSHKMLIDNVIRSQLHLYLPVFNTSELNRVLKNCNVQLTQSSLASIKKERILHYTDIVIQKDINNILPGEGEEEVDQIIGEKPDNSSSPLQTQSYFEVIDFLRRFQLNLHERRVDIGVSFLKQVWKRLKNSCTYKPDPTAEQQLAVCSARIQVLFEEDWEHSGSYRNQDERTRVAAYRETIKVEWDRIHQRMLELKSNITTSSENKDHVLAILMKLLQRFDDMASRNRYEEQILSEISDVGKLCMKYASHDVLTKLLDFFWKNLLTKDIITHIQNNPKDFDIQAHGTVAQLFIANPKEPGFEVEWNKSCRDWLKHFGSEEWTFQPKIMEQFPEMKEPHDQHLNTVQGNPLLSVLISNHQVPKQMRILLWLATIPLTHMEELDRSNNLPYDILQEFSSGMIRSLRFLMITRPLQEREQPLYHKFFNLKSSFQEVSSYDSFLQRWNSL